MDNIALIDLLNQQKTLPLADLTRLIETADEKDRQYAADLAADISRSRFGMDIFTRGIIEFSNYCKNNCYYCGIRRGNGQLERFRLTKEQILDCCHIGYHLGFRTFVLQSGEDEYFTDDKMVDIIRTIKSSFADCAITLSLGEKQRSTYEKYFAAGADRYLLRHETANPQHYARLHPPDLSLANRIRCLRDLRDIGFQTGCGCMVGSPYQTAENLAEDLLFMADFKPHMVGIGPYLPHRDTPFRNMPPGSVTKTLLMLSLTRIMLPPVLLPATTALGTAQQDGRILGILAGANVIMPNISPLNIRNKYELYNHKLGIHSDAQESANILRRQVEQIGYRLRIDRGDYRN